MKDSYYLQDAHYVFFLVFPWFQHFLNYSLHSKCLIRFNQNFTTNQTKTQSPFRHFNVHIRFWPSNQNTIQMQVVSVISIIEWVPPCLNILGLQGKFYHLNGQLYPPILVRVHLDFQQYWKSFIGHSIISVGLRLTSH